MRRLPLRARLVSVGGGDHPAHWQRIARTERSHYAMGKHCRASQWRPTPLALLKKIKNRSRCDPRFRRSAVWKRTQHLSLLTEYFVVFVKTNVGGPWDSRCGTALPDFEHRPGFGRRGAAAEAASVLPLACGPMANNMARRDGWAVRRRTVALRRERNTLILAVFTRQDPRRIRDDDLLGRTRVYAGGTPL